MTACDCVCGHGREHHEHYRPGSDCGLCGPEVCRKYRSTAGLLTRLAAAVRRLAGPGRS